VKKIIIKINKDMKYSLLAGLTSAHTFYPAAQTQLDTSVNSLFCQPVTEDFDFFDLRSFDALNRDKTTHTPSVLDAGFTDNSAFMYKTCQPPWEMKASYYNDETDGVMADDVTCPTIGTAYWVVDGECKYSFLDAKFDGLNEDVGQSGEDTNIGFQLKFKSLQNCGDGDDKFKFKLNAYCADNNSTNNGFSIVSQSECEAEAKYTGPEACKTKTIDIEKYMAAIAPFIGAILIIFGGLMTFAGAKFFFQVFALLVSLLVAAILFLASYNWFLPESTGKGLLIGVLAFCSVVGLGAGWVAYKSGRSWAVPLLGGWVGIAVGMSVIRVVGVQKNLPTVAAAVIGAVAGFFLGHKLNRLIRSVGTAIIGSYLLIRGIGSYAGNYPSMTDFADSASEGDVPYNTAILAYFGGNIVLAIVGSIVQLRIFRDENIDKEDEFAGEDEGRKCGCF